MEPTVLVPAGCRLGESALWHTATGTLMWLDLFDRLLFVYDPVSGSVRRLTLALEAPLGAAIETGDPQIILVTHPHGVARVDLRDGAALPFADPENGRDSVSYNDCKVDHFGRLWLGTSDLPEKQPRGALWCLEESGLATLGDVGFTVSNGPAFSPDGRSLYFNDTFGRRTLRYDIAPDDPHPRNRRVLISFEDDEGYPDGMTVDAEGCLWVAHWAGARLTRLSLEGERMAVVRLPCRNVTSVCFGGDAYDTLFVTTAREGDMQSPCAGHIFSLRPGVTGLPEKPFRLSAAD